MALRDISNEDKTPNLFKSVRLASFTTTATTPADSDIDADADEVTTEDATNLTEPAAGDVTTEDTTREVATVAPAGGEVTTEDTSDEVTAGDTPTGNTTADCGKGMRVRRNVNTLSEAEKGRLVSAMEALIESGRYEDLCSIHGDPISICSDYCCQHDVLMLPWHRLYMIQMEDELGEPLPYWDWTEDDQLPDLWEGIKAPIKKGASSHCEAGKQFVTRRAQIEIDIKWLRDTARTALESENFAEFHKQIHSPHSILHSSVGCEMAASATGSYDPIFFLHHSYVDHLFAYWQELHQLRGESEPFVAEFDKPIPPFDRGEVKNGFKNDNQRTLRKHMGRDTLNYKGNYCYEYDQLLFEGMTPAQYLKNKKNQFGAKKFRSAATSDVPRHGKCGQVCSTRRFKSYCEAVCATDKDGKSLVKVFVGVVLPKVAPSGINSFDLCQEGKCVNGGKVGTFGKTTRHADNPSEAHVDGKNFYLTEVDVTEVMDKQGWSLKKQLEAKMTSSMVGNLPEPVVIFKELGKGGKVVRRNATLSRNVHGALPFGANRNVDGAPYGASRRGDESESEWRRPSDDKSDEKLHYYGNLLDNYSL